VDKEQIINVGGTPEKAVTGDYTIDIKQVMEEAWATTRVSRVSINVGILLSLCIGMLVTYVVSQYMGGIEKAIEDPQTRFMINVIVTLVISPFVAGVEMMGVLHAVSMKTQPKMVFSFLNKGSLVAICALLISTFTSIGLSLFLLPGFFLLVTLSLTIPLIVEKNMMPIKAIILSIKALRFQFFKLLAIYSILFMALLCSMFPFLVLLKTDLAFIGIILFLFALTYLAPLFYNIKGILYREIFGIQLKAGEAKEAEHSGNFSA
jgi:hypothetical protein